MRIIGQSPSVLTCLGCRYTVWATFNHSQCRCGQVSAFGGRMYVSLRKH